MEVAFIEPTYGLYHLYILECAEERFYVGVSKNPRKRFKMHRAGNGAKYTERYRPIRIYKTKALGKMDYKEAEKYENLCTLLWKKELGSDKVTGGIYCHRGISKKRIAKKISLASKNDLKKIIRPFTVKKKKNKRKKLNTSRPLPEVHFDIPRLGKKTGRDGIKSLIVHC